MAAAYPDALLKGLPSVNKNVLIIGAGGVGHVVAHKLASADDAIGDIHVASRSIDKCDDIVASIRARSSARHSRALRTHRLDAFEVESTKSLILRIEADIVVNVGPSFLNMSVLRAAMEAGAAYIDTAIHEDRDKICEQPTDTPTMNGLTAMNARRRELMRSSVLAWIRAWSTPMLL